MQMSYFSFMRLIACLKTILASCFKSTNNMVLNDIVADLPVEFVPHVDPHFDVDHKVILNMSLFSAPWFSVLYLVWVRYSMCSVIMVLY